jgi:hypothetical protein
MSDEAHDEIQALRTALKQATAERDAARVLVIEAERFLRDAGALDLPTGCTDHVNVVALAFRASCTLERMRRELAAAKGAP